MKARGSSLGALVDCPGMTVHGRSLVVDLVGLLALLAVLERLASSALGLQTGDFAAMPQ
jgi:hypothetical protein